MDEELRSNECDAGPQTPPQATAGAALESTSHPISTAASTHMAWLKPASATLGVSWNALGQIRPLRHGTGKTIFEAEFEGRDVVVKTPKEGLTAAQIYNVTQELQHEAAILSSLSAHENVVQFFGFGTVPLPDERIVYYLVVEHLKNGTLARQLGSESPKRPSNIRLPMTEVLSMLLSLADAMLFLHQGAHERYTIVHRDLKPDNIGFDAQGVLKVFDFGLSCVIPKDRAMDFPITGQIGSVRYMAPEIAIDTFYNEAVDVYSFGLVAWEIAHGKKPFLGLNVDAHRRVVSLEGGRPDVDRSRPREFADFLAACWHPDPRHRPSFEEVLLRIQHMSSSILTHPQQQQSFSVMRRFGLTSNP